ncbi:MAG: hypothetical protein ACTSQJ_13630, partial [Promethearchaeota archaeon]
IYFIVKSMEPSKRPMLLLYHSSNTNFYIPIKDITIQVNAWIKHKSQLLFGSPKLEKKFFLILRKIFYTLKRIKTGPIIAEGFRRVDFSKDENKLKKLRHRIFYYIIAKSFSGFSENYYRPTPKELGLLTSL